MYEADIAKAVQSVAKLGEKSLETSEKLGGFFATVFKEPFEEISGMITDRLRFVRWVRLAQMADGVNKILVERGISETRAVPPRLALPLLEEASLEEDEILGHLWINLLANSMDPTFNGELRYGFVEMIKNITGVEATILSRIYDGLKSKGRLENKAQVANYTFKKEDIKEMLGIDEDRYQVSIYNLMRTQCIGPALLQGGGHDPLAKPSFMIVYKGIDAVVLTPLGVKFVEACIR